MKHGANILQPVRGDRTNCRAARSAPFPAAAAAPDRDGARGADVLSQEDARAAPVAAQRPAAAADRFRIGSSSVQDRFGIGARDLYRLIC